MITLCKNIKELDFLPADPFAARITAYAETYGFDRDFAIVWTQTLDGEPVGAVAKVDGAVTLCCTEKTDFEELSAFLNVVGWSSITSEEKSLESLGIEADKKSFIVSYDCSDKYKAENLLYDYDKKEIFELLCECGFEMGDYSAFLADVCARLNKGTAKLACIDDNGLQACAFKLFIGQKSVLLGAVATRETARGKGYASALVRSLAGEEKNRKVFLFCRNDGLLNFYSKTGFAECGRWAIAENN